jgi:hypothetical protein
VSGAGYLTPAMSHRRSATGDCVLPVVRRVLLPARADAASWPSGGRRRCYASRCSGCGICMCRPRPLSPASQACRCAAGATTSTHAKRSAPWLVTAMSEWRGMFDHADHYSTGSRASCGRCGEWCASCGRCGEWCYPHDPCSCCEKQALGDQTAAEVLAEPDALKAQVQRVRDVLGDVGK